MLNLKNPVEGNAYRRIVTFFLIITLTAPWLVGCGTSAKAQENPTKEIPTLAPTATKAAPTPEATATVTVTPTEAATPTEAVIPTETQIPVTALEVNGVKIEVSTKGAQVMAEICSGIPKKGDKTIDCEADATIVWLLNSLGMSLAASQGNVDSAVKNFSDYIQKQLSYSMTDDQKKMLTDYLSEDPVLKTDNPLVTYYFQAGIAKFGRDVVGAIKTLRGPVYNK